MLAFANSRVRRSWARNVLALALGAATFAASAATVVVGGYDPTTKRAYVLKNVLVSSFLDGQPITGIRAAYSEVSKSYYLVREGRFTSGVGCRKEFFRLVPVAGNQLALADPSQPKKAWQSNGILTKLHPTFDCTSDSCFDCLGVGDAALGDEDLVMGTGYDTRDALVDLEGGRCGCSGSLPTSAQGPCKTTRPGLGGYSYHGFLLW